MNDNISSNSRYTISASQQSHPGPLPSSRTSITSTVDHQPVLHQVTNRATLQYQPQAMAVTIGANTRSQPVAGMLQQQQRILYGSSTVANNIQQGKHPNMQQSVYNQSVVQNRGVSNHMKLPLLQPKPVTSSLTSSLGTSQVIVNPMNQLMVKNPPGSGLVAMQPNVMQHETTSNHVTQGGLHAQQGLGVSQMRQQTSNAVNPSGQSISSQVLPRPPSRHTPPQLPPQPVRNVPQGLSVNAALNQVLLSATTKSIPQRSSMHVQPAGTVHHHSVVAKPDGLSLSQVQNQLLQQLQRQTGQQQVTLSVQSQRVNAGFSGSSTQSIASSSVAMATRASPSLVSYHAAPGSAASAASQLVDSVSPPRHLTPQPHVQHINATTATQQLTQWPHLQPKQTNASQQPVIQSVNQVVQPPGRPVQTASSVQQVRQIGVTSVQSSVHQPQLQARQTFDRSSLQPVKPKQPLQPQVFQQLQQTVQQQTQQQQQQQAARQLVNSVTSQPLLQHEATPSAPITTSVPLRPRPQLQVQTSRLQAIQPVQLPLQREQMQGNVTVSTIQNVRQSHAPMPVQQAQQQPQQQSIVPIVQMAASQPPLPAHQTQLALHQQTQQQPQEPMQQLQALQQHQLQPNVAQMTTVAPQVQQVARQPANATIHHTQQTQPAKPQSLVHQLQAPPQVASIQQSLVQQPVKQQVTSSVQQLPVVQLQTVQTPSRQGQSSSVQQLRLVTSSGSSFQLPSNQQQVTLIQLQPGQQGQAFQTQTADGKVLQFRLVTGNQAGSLSNVRPVLLQGGNVKTVLTSGVPFQTVKAVKRPATEVLAGQPVKQPTGIHGALYRQKQSVLQLNCKTAFTSVDDAISRLLPYHICDQPEDDPAAQTFDQVFDVVCKQLVSRRNQMSDKYRMLLFKEAQCDAPSSEKVMVSRMFLSDEKQRLAQDKQQLIDEKQTILNEMNPERQEASKTETEASNGNA